MKGPKEGNWFSGGGRFGVWLTHEEGIDLCTTHGFAFLLVPLKFYQGVLRAVQAHEEDRIIRRRQGLAASHAMGAKMYAPYNLALLAEAYGKLGRGAEGLAITGESVAVMDTMEERHYEAEGID